MSTLADLPPVHDRRQRLLGIVTGIALGMALIGMLWTGKVAYDNCTRVSGIQMVLQQQGERALASLPALSYYQTHPQELAMALKQVRQQIRDDAPISCSVTPF